MSHPPPFAKYEWNYTLLANEKICISKRKQVAQSLQIVLIMSSVLIANNNYMYFEWLMR